MDLEKETRRPRLRAAKMLFGVLAVSSSAGAATHYALCDRRGEPACGNIGQLGRDAPPPAPAIIEPQPITNTTVTHNAPLIAITISTQLVAPPPPPAPKVTVDPRDPLGPEFIEPVVQPVVSRPLVDEAGDPMPGNVIHGKGGRRD